MTHFEGKRWAEPIYCVNRRTGPETVLEDAVIAELRWLLPSFDRPSCVFGSRTIGAGAPDLTVVYCDPTVAMLANLNPASMDILAYLRVVNQARADTLAERLRIKRRVLDGWLDALCEAGAVQIEGRTYALSGSWRCLLREIVTIEAKVSKWRDVVSQASRNRVFAHRSFVALPESQARLAAQDCITAKLGIGVIAVTGTGAKLIRRSRRSQPRAWRYYFELACASARQLEI